MQIYSDREAAFERNINEIETFLSVVSVTPVLGSIAGGAKILLGITQTVTAIAYGILFALPDLLEEKPHHLNRAWTHIEHGLGNIVAGIIESLPVIQTLFYLMRLRCKTHEPLFYDNPDDKEVYVSTGYDEKLMPYQSLVERDWGIVGENKPTLSVVNEIFQELYKTKTKECWSKNLYRKEKKFVDIAKKMKIAQKAIVIEKNDRERYIIENPKIWNEEENNLMLLKLSELCDEGKLKF